MKIEGDTYIFSSGHKMYANRAIVGINPDLELSGGYDGDIDWPYPEWKRDHADADKWLTDDDMRELADHMIERWSQFKATLDK